MTGASYSPHSRLYCISCNRLIIKDLLCISPLQSPHCIPLFEPESTGPFGTLADRSCDRSTPETLPPGPSSGMASCQCCRSEISACEHAPGLHSRPLAICGLVFFEGLVDEGAQPAAEVEVPLGAEALEPLPGFGRDADRKRYTAQHKDTQQHIEQQSGVQHYTETHASTVSAKRRSMAFPPGITVVRATLRKGEGKGDVLPVTLYPARWRTSAKKHGVALTTSIPPVRRAVAPGGRGTREAQPPFSFPWRTREIRVIPRLVQRFGEVLNHNGEGSAL